MEEADPHGLVGEVLADKYEVESVVGAGGFATVYRARHRVWNRPVALKVWSGLGATTLDEQQKLVDAFLREGAILAELSERSPAICQARDAGTVTTTRGVTLSYLVLEWLDGSTLADLLDVELALGRPARTVREAVSLLGPIAGALAVAHQRGVVHRDIKPANIFVVGDPTDDDCAVKLLDFGVAKVFSGAAPTAGAPAWTVGPFSAFTPAYAAPEQFSRALGGPGPWTDVYALALVLVEIIARREPQGGVDLASIASVALDPARRPTPRTFGLAVDDAVESVFARALEVSPAGRYPDVASLFVALHDALEIEPFRAPAANARTRSAPRSPRVALELAETQDRPQSLPPATHPSRGRRSPHHARWIGLALASFVVAWFAIPQLRSLHASNRPPLLLTSTAPVARPAPSAPVRALAKTSTCADGMVPVPGGPFFMGDDEGTPPERPAHQVRVAPFCIDRFEVTAGAYKKCSDAGECKRAGTTNAWDQMSPHEASTFDPLCNGRAADGDRAEHPANCIDWSMATRFCQARGRRLPTEAEWELAARGPDGRRYPWGDGAPGPTLLNACGTECVAWGKAHGEQEHAMYGSDDGWATTSPVGSFHAGASPYGAEDMVGNVWEWVDDWYGSYRAAAQKDSPPPSAGTSKVIRGGSWNGADPSWVRPTFRFMRPPNERSYGVGFRCAATLSSNEPT